jgi:hypothetical protein
VLAATVNETVPLPEAEVGLIPVIIEGVDENASQMHDDSGTDGKFGTAVTSTVLFPPLAPKNVLFAFAEYVQFGIGY